MKHAIDNVTGVVVFIPENEQDRKALFHLMDCSDLTEFSEYIRKTGEQDNITQDLGVTARETYVFLVAEVYEAQVTEQLVNRQPEITGTALIGFDRR